MNTYKNILKAENRPKIGVVLGGGGVRCCASLELFKLLENAEIPIDLLVGCSAGAICAGLKAIGLSVDEMKISMKKLTAPASFSKMNYKYIFNMLGFYPSLKFESKGFIDSRQVKNDYNKIVGDVHIEDLKIKTFIEAVNLETGQGIVIKEGSLAQAVYASTALLPMLAPVYFNGQWLVDGGFADPLPVLAAINSDVDIIIVMDFDEKQFPQPVNFLEYYYNFIAQCYSSTIHLQNSLAVNLHHYDIIFISLPHEKPISVFDMSSLDQIYEQGRISIEGFKERIIHSIEQFPFRDIAPT